MRGGQRLRIDVERIGRARAEFRGGDREHAGAAAVVDRELAVLGVLHRATRGTSPSSACVPVPKARPGSSRTTTAPGVCTCAWCGDDPQALAETHRVEVAQPFALPDAVRERLEREPLAGNAQHVRKARDEFLRRRVERKQRLQPRVRPQPEFARRRLEDRVVALIGVRHRERAELEAGVLDALGVEPVQRQREGQLRHGFAGAT